MCFWQCHSRLVLFIMRYVSVMGTADTQLNKQGVDLQTWFRATSIKECQRLSHSMRLTYLSSRIPLFCVCSVAVYFIHLFIYDSGLTYYNLHSVCLGYEWGWFSRFLNLLHWGLSATDEWSQKDILLQAQASWGHLQCSRISLVKHIPA